MIVCTGSFKPGYLTYCVKRHLVQAPPSANCAPTSNPLLWLSPVLPQPNACCSEAGGHSAVPAAPLYCHSSESAADEWRCLPSPQPQATGPRNKACAIRGLIKSARGALKTENSLKGYSNLIQCQEESFVGFSIPNKNISKFNQLDFHLVFVHLLSGFGGVMMHCYL